MSTRAIVAGDLLALLAFALLGLASHEHEVTLEALARTFAPFAVAWLVIGGPLDMLKPDPEGRPVTGRRLIAIYAVAGVTALVGRSIVFERTLFSAFFMIALLGNGLFLYGWRAAAGAWLERRSAPINSEEATQP